MKKSSKIVLCISLAAVLVCSMACTAFAAHVGDAGDGHLSNDAFDSFKVYGCRFTYSGSDSSLDPYIDNLEFSLPVTPVNTDKVTDGVDSFLIGGQPGPYSTYDIVYKSQTKRNNGTAVNRVSIENDSVPLYADYLSCLIDDFYGVQPRFGLRMDGDAANAPKVYEFTVTVDVPYARFITGSNEYNVAGGIRSFTYGCSKIVDNNSLVYPFYDTFNVYSSFSGVHNNVSLQSVIEQDLLDIHNSDGVTFGSEQVRTYRDMSLTVRDDRGIPIQLVFTTECWEYEESETEWHFGRSLDKQNITEVVDVRPFDWVVQAGQSALDFELLPNFTVGHILLVMLAIPILIAVLRLIAGG